MIIGWRAQAQLDTLQFFNGQRLIGEIKNAQMGVITIDDKDLRLTQIKLYKIKRMVTNRPFRIETTDRKIYYGRLEPSTEDGIDDIVLNDSTRIPISLTDINVLISLDKNFFKRLAGNFSLGFSYAKSSGVGQINMSALVQYATQDWTFQLTGSEIGSIDSSSFSRDNEALELFGTYNFNAAWFAASTLGYQRNLELSLSRRFQQMLGGGNKFMVKRDWTLMGISGIAFNQEKYTDGGASGLLLEVPVMLRFNYYKFKQPNLQISTVQAVFFGITQHGRIRYSGSTNLSWEMIKDFWLTLTPYMNYDNQPPANGSTFDWGIAMSVTYRF